MAVRTVTEDDRTRVVRLHMSNVPSSHIARRTGLSRATVNAIIRKHKRAERKLAQA